MLQEFLRTINLTVILPELVLTVFTLVILVWGLYTKERDHRQMGHVAILGIVLAFVGLVFAGMALEQGRISGDYFGGMVTADRTAFFLKGVVLLVAAMVTLLSMDYLGRRLPKIQVEYYELVLEASLGMMFMVGSRDLTMIYLGLELTSITSYILAGLLRKDPRSNEAALKYFLNGAVASAVLLFGVSLLYGLSGTTHLETMAYRLSQLAETQIPLLVVALIFVVGGFAFKVAAAPFHLWAPDAYEGAPTPVTAFFSVGPKGAAFGAILRVFLIGLGIPALEGRWTVLFAVLSAASMFIGNLTALMQSNVKRMMAYSSISHAGYILVGVVAGDAGASSVLYYLLAYALGNLGIFAIILVLEEAHDSTDLSVFRGLFYRQPLLAAAMLLFFISLIGIPFTVGFFGKLFLFQAAVQTGYLWLAILMAVNSAISVGYYYGVVRTMFFDKPAEEKLAVAPGLNFVVTVAVAGVLLVALFTNQFIGYASLAAQ